MRLFRIILAALFAVFTVLAGLFTAAVVGLAGALFVLIRRLLSRRGVSRLPKPRPGRMAGSNTDVIDVSATEVSDSADDTRTMSFTARSPN